VSDICLFIDKDYSHLRVPNRQQVLVPIAEHTESRQGMCVEYAAAAAAGYRLG
jgi:hypothetical protein